MLANVLVIVQALFTLMRLRVNGQYNYWFRYTVSSSICFSNMWDFRTIWVMLIVWSGLCKICVVHENFGKNVVTIFYKTISNINIVFCSCLQRNINLQFLVTSNDVCGAKSSHICQFILKSNFPKILEHLIDIHIVW